MAKYWYIVKCDKCMEAKTCFVNDPTTSEAYLGEYSSQIRRFLDKHYGCDLKIIHRDDQLDQLWEEGYQHSDLNWEKKDYEIGAPSTSFNHYAHILKPLMFGTGKVLAVDFYVHMLSKVYDGMDPNMPETWEIISQDMPDLSGRLDWQDGVTIWQTEGIEPILYSEIMGEGLKAIKKAQSLIDPKSWECGLQKEPK
jgi:multimeric flavodoxin WrbA